MDVIKIMNQIREMASKEYKARIPAATRDNFAASSLALLTNFELMKNEFVPLLFDVIGKTKFKLRSAANNLKGLKTGDLPNGRYVREVIANPTKSKTFNGTTSELLNAYNPDVKMALYELNRQDQYITDVQIPQMQLALTSMSGMSDFIQMLTEVNPNGNEVDERLLMKNILGLNIDNGGMIIKEVPNIVSGDNGESGKAFTIVARQLFNEFQLPLDRYNAYNLNKPAEDTGADLTTWTNKDDIVIILRTDVAAYLDVEVLAAAFNIDKASLFGNVYQVEDFGEGDGTEGNASSRTMGVIMDRAYYQIYDNVLESGTNYDVTTMRTKNVLNVWQVIKCSPFANAVALVATEG